MNMANKTEIKFIFEQDVGFDIRIDSDRSINNPKPFPTKKKKKNKGSFYIKY